jgi:hypothetical protein
MQSLESIKDKGQESLNRLVDLGKSQPAEVQTWSVTGGAAVAGALAVMAVAKGVLAIVGTLANPPVALTVGALAGGAIGWSFMQKSTGAEGSVTGESVTGESVTGKSGAGESAVVTEASTVVEKVQNEAATADGA